MENFLKFCKTAKRTRKASFKEKRRAVYQSLKFYLYMKAQGATEISKTFNGYFSYHIPPDTFTPNNSSSNPGYFNQWRTIDAQGHYVKW